MYVDNKSHDKRIKRYYKDFYNQLDVKYPKNNYKSKLGLPEVPKRVNNSITSLFFCKF